MALRDIPAVHRIERASFPIPWPAYAFQQELETNRMAHYLTVQIGPETVGYAGIWLMVDEAHITTFAVLPAWRRRGIGGRLMHAVMELAERMNARVATLEVRLSNMPARRLYQLFGFKPVGVRPRYYSDNGEDALIMTTDRLASEPMRKRLARLAQRYGPDSALRDVDADATGADGSTLGADADEGQASADEDGPGSGR
jgi:ribosomal-protein-alanine N-acetyltransferase